MVRESIADLIAKLHSGKVDRRDFLKRATAAGLTATLAGQVLSRHASAQDGTPAAGTSSTSIGVPGVEHITDTSKGEIKLYSSWPLTGSYDQLGNDAVEAIKLCLADFGNAAGGFALTYEALDDGIAANNGGWDSAAESNNANKVIGDENAVVYLGTYNSGAAKVSIPILNNPNGDGVTGSEMAMISYANTGVGLTKLIEGVTDPGEPDIYFPTGKRNYMRVCPADDIQGQAGANWATGEMGRTKAYVLHDKSYYGKGVADVFRAQFAANGGEVLGFEGYEPKADDYQSLMTSIAAAGPDIVMVGATVDNNPAKVLQDMRTVMSVDDVIFLGPDGCINEAFVTGAGEAADGAYLTFAGYTPDELVRLGGPGADYVTRITEILGHSPDAYAVYAYETTVVVLQALDKVGEKDRAKVLDAMFSTEGFVSLLGGTWSFTDTGDTDSAIIGLSQIVDNKITYQKTIAGGAA
jgi:branched-chain amino acid transport system substrate-binding protein